MKTRSRFADSESLGSRNRRFRVFESPPSHNNWLPKRKLGTRFPKTWKESLQEYDKTQKQSRHEWSIDERNFETQRRRERRGSVSERALRPLRLCVSNLQNFRRSQPANEFSEASSKIRFPIRGNTFVELDSLGSRPELMTRAPQSQTAGLNSSEPSYGVNLLRESAKMSVSNRPFDQQDLRCLSVLALPPCLLYTSDAADE